MKVHETGLPGVLLLEPTVYRDPRGFFLETFHAERYAACGIAGPFVQDNHSRSIRGTLRGLHAQLAPAAQGKLVRVVAGEIFDVAVDIRVGSPSFKRWHGATLSGENFKQLSVPPGFAHGFLVLSEQAEVEYKCTAAYDPACEISIHWQDEEIGIEWPLASPLVSARDEAAPRFSEMTERLPRWDASRA